MRPDACFKDTDAIANLEFLALIERRHDIRERDFEHRGNRSFRIVLFDAIQYITILAVEMVI
jgi:hypothetical protein